MAPLITHYAANLVTENTIIAGVGPLAPRLNEHTYSLEMATIPNLYKKTLDVPHCVQMYLLNLKRRPYKVTPTACLENIVIHQTCCWQPVQVEVGILKASCSVWYIIELWGFMGTENKIFPLFSASLDRVIGELELWCSICRFSIKCSAGLSRL